MYMIPLRTPLVEVLFPLHVHKIQLVYQPMTLQQF